MSEFGRANGKFNEKEITAGSSNSKGGNPNGLDSVADIKDMAQLKQHLGKIEEIYIGLNRSWKTVEEKHDHIVISLEAEIKTLKVNLVDAQLLATEEREQMKVLQQKISKQHEEDIHELSNVRKEKSVIEQSLQETKKQSDELNAEIAVQKQRTEQTMNELNKKNKELSAASQEINFFKIQLDAEKDILKTTTKNHDQVIDYLKEQLKMAKENLVDVEVSSPEEVNSVTEEIVEVGNTEMLVSSDLSKEGTEEKNQEVYDPIAELQSQVALMKAQFSVDKGKNTPEIPETNRKNENIRTVIQDVSTLKVQLQTNKEEEKKTPPEQGNRGGNFRQTAQQAREQLKMKLQGLSES